MKRSIRHWRTGGLSALLLASVLVALNLGAAAEAQAPGNAAGQEACLQCHAEVSGVAFARTAHGRAAGGAVACESCHGPGQAHVDAGGDASAIGRGDSEQGTAACLACHGGRDAAHWRASSHDKYDLQCADCHATHRPWAAEGAPRNEEITATCLGCHQEMRKHLYQRSGHPLKNGLMSCVSCHSPHGSTAESAIAAVTPNDKCYECHAEKRGPFLYEHQPVREDCSTCHDPHGSNQTMMLTTSAPRLCQSCHSFGHHQTVPGEPNQIWMQNRSCVNCHNRIHGSNHPSGVVFLR